jgi:SAM-dependent methyltransferase
MNFFDEHPVLNPWPWWLRRSAFKVAYKPREVWWQKCFKDLKLKTGEQVLEVGCGEGVWLDRLATKYGVSGFGIDMSSRAIGIAKKNSGVKGNTFLKVSACRIPFEEASFDAVFSLDTLEHIQDQGKAVEEMIRVLKPGGRILIYTINSKQNWTWNKLMSCFGLDVYREVEHDPKLFVEIKWLEERLESRGVRVEKRDYFDAFFTLAADEAIMVFLAFWQKFLGWENTGRFAMIFLGLLTRFSRVITPMLRVLDYPWVEFGNANGLLIIGYKE